mmetsp:Transcript_17915/g.57251  ORF Transcript_17915/g.57251 Transcript_17915/m.57251 type:complete len:482 (+) Transcript_17915:37-1482(+)
MRVAGRERAAHVRFARQYARVGASRRRPLALCICVCFALGAVLLLEQLAVLTRIVIVKKAASIRGSEVQQSGSADPIAYWTRRTAPATAQVAVLPPPAAISHDRYVTFEDDTGGWNNIRMAFEVFVVVAKVTGRVLVLPPRCRFYLLDRGPITAFTKDEERKQTSGYGDYYDLERLGQTVRIISTDEFLDREAAALGVPDDVLQFARGPQLVSNGHHSDYFLWLRKSSDAVIWPSGPRVTSVFDLAAPPPYPEKKLIHFPMHVSQNLRYLTGVPPLIQQTPQPLTLAVKDFLRSDLVYGAHIYDTARAYVRLLGGFNGFAALHVRRNELQYKNVFVPGETTADNVAALFRAGETVYIATDETSPGFFDAFTKLGVRPVQMQDLRDEVIKLAGPVHPKFEGMIEQVICAAARVFAGTPFSSYSAHIFRLRHLMHDSPNVDPDERGCFYHTAPYSSDPTALEAHRERCTSAFIGEILIADAEI